MYYAVIMKILHSFHDLIKVSFSQVLLEFAPADNILVELASVNVLGDYVYLLFSLNEFVEANNIRVVGPF